MDREITIPSPNDSFENAFGSLATPLTEVTSVGTTQLMLLRHKATVEKSSHREG